MSKADRIHAAQKAVDDKKAEAKRVDAELAELKLVYRNTIVSSDDVDEVSAELAEIPVPDFED